MGKQRLTARSDKRARKKPAASTASCSKKRVRFADEVEYIEPPSEAASASSSADVPSVPVGPGDLGKYLDIVGMPGTIGDYPAEHRGTLLFMHNHCEAFLNAKADKEEAEWKAMRGSRRAQIRLDEAMHEHKRDNVLDIDMDEDDDWLSRGWRCYAFEAFGIDGCEREVRWQFPQRRPSYSRCHCIMWQETALLSRKRRKIKDLCRLNGRRFHARRKATFDIPLDFGVMGTPLAEHADRMSGCVRCGWCDGESECSRLCQREEKALDAEPSDWDDFGGGLTAYD